MYTLCCPLNKIQELTKSDRLSYNDNSFGFPAKGEKKRGETTRTGRDNPHTIDDESHASVPPLSRPHSPSLEQEAGGSTNVYIQERETAHRSPPPSNFPPSPSRLSFLACAHLVPSFRGEKQGKREREREQGRTGRGGRG